MVFHFCVSIARPPFRRRALLVLVLSGLCLPLPYAASSLAQSAPANGFAPTTTPVPLAMPSQTNAFAPAAATGSSAATPAAGAISAVPGEATHAPDDNQNQLDAIEKAISISQQRADQLRKEIADMNGDRAKQNAALIAAGQRVKIAEIEVDSMESRLADLAAAEKDVHGRLDGADSSISSMLAALERISLNPPPALIVDPSDALSSARSAMLISAIVPQLRAKADQVVVDLKHLGEIRIEAQREQEELKANFAVLEEEQLRIATLIEARRQGIAAATTELDAEETQAQAAAAKATSLKQLIAQLTSKVNAVSSAASAANLQLPQRTPEAIRLALADTSRTAPAIPFSTARGYLTLPASGTDVQDYGTNDGLGGIAQGISYTTRPGAQVVAPADGSVIYKGPYLNYGQIVILNPGQDYTIVLAGLDAVSVQVGQFVLEGEPLGAMGSRTIARTVATSAGVSQPTLYIELRKNNQPLDPTGWWAPPANTTQSG